MLNSISEYSTSCSCTRNPGMYRMDTSGTDCEKENMEPLSPLKSSDNTEMSFYENENESATEIECAGTSPSHCRSLRHKRELVDDFDPNSQDSGYGTTYYEGLRRFTSFVSPTRSSQHSQHASFGSLGSHEDGFLESMSDFEVIDENLPVSFKTLINGEISALNENVRLSPQDVAIRPLFRRALSLQNESNTPNSSRVRSCLFQEDMKRFKRPEPPTESDTSPNNKRTRVVLGSEIAPRRPVLKRAFSASEESIKFAVQRSAEEELIGDFSRTYSLPLTQGRHQDLKSITSHTLAGLMKGQYDHVIESFRVIDCRYPYEFNGGHIDGAINIYTKDQCLELLDQRSINCSTDNKRHILIFHCEFSSERGPNLFRYLRQQDRSKNEAAYPALQYPEIYLLEGGYNTFFSDYSQMCVPVAYKQMLHPEHEEDLRYFRMKSKTWNADTRQRSHRGNLKRLGL